MKKGLFFLFMVLFLQHTHSFTSLSRKRILHDYDEFLKHQKENHFTHPSNQSLDPKKLASSDVNSNLNKKINTQK